MMTKAEATKLSKHIAKNAPTVCVIGLRHWARMGYEIGCRDLITGYQFTVFSADDWSERQSIAIEPRP